MDSRENNKLIVEFLGWEKVGTYTYKSLYITEELADFDNRQMETINKFSILFDDMKFNTDWNWLMQVVEKIDSILPCDSFVTIAYKDCFIPVLEDEEPFTIECNGESKIQAVYNACLEFIKWYNEQSK